MYWNSGVFVYRRSTDFADHYLAQRSIVRHIVQEKKINIIHQPIPVLPKEPSMIFGMSVPVNYWRYEWWYGLSAIFSTDAKPNI